jgi:soluble lytic murein transglycosylase
MVLGWQQLLLSWLPPMQKKRVYQMVGASLVSVLALSAIAKVLHNRAADPLIPFLPSAGLQDGAVQVQDINTLKSLEPKKRAEKLSQIAKNSPSLGQSRARYLLATELLQQGQAQKALEQLDQLDKAYPVLASHIQLKRAQAQAQTGDTAAAQQTWQTLVAQAPQDPATAEALFALGKTNPTYWDQALQQFPAHPRTLEIAQQRLKQNPNQPELLKQIAKHGLYLDGYTRVLDLLVEKHGNTLQPEDWEAVAFGYWENQAYGKAGAAYAKAPYTAHNAYRIGRGLQLGEKGGATDAYIRAVNTFPTAPETGLALMRLSKIVKPELAIAYLDQVIQRFPARIGEALLQKAKLQDEMNNPQAAAQTRQFLLSQQGRSDAAAELRWQLAQKSAEAGDIATAQKWAAPIVSQNPESEFAPEATYWVGKWATQQGKTKDAQQAFEQVLSRHPQSYYAWRSADMLGWDVGDFTSVRQLNPPVNRPAARPPLPSGSEALRELYQLGQDQEAWKLWQAEFHNPDQPSVAEQFTDGVMRLGVGDHLDGIFMVSFLSERDKPEEQAQYKDLKKQLGYWYALYPFPYLEPIEAFSQERQLNPLLVTALIRQESRFMSDITSSAGAVGLMQVMPDTGAWVAEKIKLKEYKLDDPEDNIKLGTWYLDYTHSEYANNSMLAVASYNAGPGAVGDWVAKKGVGDPDQFVESIPYSETRGYVKSVFENYWNYLRLYNPEIAQKLAQVSQHAPKAQ